MSGTAYARAAAGYIYCVSFTAIPHGIKRRRILAQMQEEMNRIYERGPTSKALRAQGGERAR